MEWTRKRKSADPVSDEKRFWSHVNRIGEGECWEWTAGVDKDGESTVYNIVAGRAR
jgi:hypothetical protein